MNVDFSQRPRAEIFNPSPAYVARKWDDEVWSAQGYAQAKGGSIGFGDGRHG